ncbi:hypothetical protein R1sor_005834 [Riccia sorocarpa]|uniref:Uncharacterized protein n=1 Tax=Riccia sorocarpa TaxID=122646 RepID=A0ABD3HL84_9MARC
MIPRRCFCKCSTLDLPLVCSYWELDFRFPNLPSEEDLEDIFEDVWVYAKLAVEGLCQYLVGNRHNIFDKSAYVNRFCPRTHFLHPDHKDYAITAGLFHVFLKDFEVESFGTTSEPPTAAGQRPEDAEVRAVRSYLYFEYGIMSTDLDYIEWLRARLVKFGELFDISLPHMASDASIADVSTMLHDVGGPDLVLHIPEVAVACWKLQALAFAFGEPVVRLNVGEGDKFLKSHMVPVVDPEDEEEPELESQEDGELAQSVSFVVCPGFRFPRGPVIHAEVYIQGGQ